MLKMVNQEVLNVKAALRGMRNPMASWERGDSIFDEYGHLLKLGPNDRTLAKKLIMAGSDHRKFMRQIFFSADIIAPDYWWKEMDTYKVATVANSTSTMHKLTSRHLTLEDFSFDTPDSEDVQWIERLNGIIDQYKAARGADDLQTAQGYFRKLIQKLPMAFNYTRTWTANFETLRNIYFSRRNHKLKEWHVFCDYLERLDLAELICCPGGTGKHQ